MNMIPVSSSNLVSVGYDSSTATLRIAFILEFMITTMFHRIYFKGF
ncbi:KTSC domain-containing protein [Clostridium perfringens]|nr:KTSC domain-containing protein [Clostridium perfringens]MDG6893978.1 hypothetical protein [Clostridium perfringens]DAM84966.1 MAG TPA: KTSC domain [Caudoviricetes sp.]